MSQIEVMGLATRQVRGDQNLRKMIESREAERRALARDGLVSRPQMPLLALSVAALVALALGLSACGGSDDSSDAASPTMTTATSEPPVTAAEPGGSATTLTVDADPGGALAFTQTTLTAPAGMVTFVLANASAVPHNIGVDGNGVDSEVSETVQDGGMAEITVELPAGTYEYYCEVAGHRQAGMVGAITVE